MDERHFLRSDVFYVLPTFHEPEIECLVDLGGGRAGRAYYAAVDDLPIDQRTAAHFVDRLNELVDAEGRPAVARRLSPRSCDGGLRLG